MSKFKHSFVVCAYKDSPYLETCIKSLKEQDIKSNIILTTSTPSEYIENIAKKYNIEVFINENGKSIAKDWNFAYQKADSELVTIAHQDDIYAKDYTRYLLRAKSLYKDMSLFTCDSHTIDENGKIIDGKIEKIKKILRLPLRIFALSNISFIKRLSLSFGNPIICPSCTYDKNLCGENIFDDRYSFVLDWACLLKLAKDKKRWICIEKPLIFYRVHKKSATKACMEDNKRQEEEKFIFESLWGKKISKLLLGFYRGAYAAYEK